MQLLQERIRGRGDPVFYSGTIAEATTRDGTHLILMVSGSVDVEIYEKRYKGEQFKEAVEDYNLTDTKLEELEKSGDLVWNSQPTFEIFYRKLRDNSYQRTATSTEYTKIFKEFENLSNR